MTLTEIAQMSKAALIIPSPNVVDNHQFKNANALAQKDAAVVICEDEMNSVGCARICEAAKKILEDTAYRETLERNIKQFAKQDVEKNIFTCITDLLQSYKKI